MDCGLRRCPPARRPHPASLPIRVPAVESLLPAFFSFTSRLRLAVSLRLPPPVASGTSQPDRYSPYWPHWRRASRPPCGDEGKPISSLSKKLPHIRMEGAAYFVTWRLRKDQPETQPDRAQLDSRVSQRSSTTSTETRASVGPGCMRIHGCEWPTSACIPERARRPPPLQEFI